MFNIQYAAINGESRMQKLDSDNRGKLLVHLVKFNMPILAVYEQASPITKTMQDKMRTWRGTMTSAATEFMNRH